MVVFRVFAYGSNLSLGRIRERVGRVGIVAIARLPGNKLRFHKLGRDGSGKADSYRTGSAADSVWGAVYEMEAQAKSRLDRCEGVGSEYLEEEITVVSASGEMDALIYRAHPDRIDATLLPFDWYHHLVIAGARQHGLPAEYVAWLSLVPVRVDPDHTRARFALRHVD